MTVFGEPVVWALLMVLYPGDITPRQEIPAAVPMEDCIKVADRMAVAFNKVYVWEQPQVYCEVVPLSLKEYGDE